MCRPATRRSIFCILPPHILRQIAEHGEPDERAAAARTLSIDSTFRALRAGASRTALVTSVAVGAPSGEKRRTIYTASNQQQLPGTAVADEQHPPTVDDPAVKEAWDGLGATWDFFFDVFDRQSIDDEGMALDATVHYGYRYNNAFWNSQQMVFGDGDGRLFNRFTIAVDIIGHELAHGVVEDESGLVYLFQPGALNESLADVFGSLIRQKVAGQTAADADWLIGKGLFTSAVNGVALRSLKSPGTAYDDGVLGTDPQPAHMKDFVHTHEDNGGVHINSGIPNRAFYLTAAKLGGCAWDKAGRIWYEALRDSALRPNTGFKRFARLTAAAAARLYGAGSVEQAIVVESWQEVGIRVAGAGQQV